MRERHAADTRRRITAAAMELFAEHGFRATTVAAIAHGAEVAVPTVYATFGSKGAIMKALMTEFETAADVAEWDARIAAEDDPVWKLRLFAQWSAHLFTTSRAVILAAADATSDPAILELKTEGDRRRRDGVRELIASLAAARALAPGLSRTRATDRAWALSGLELYLATTVECRWSQASYADWLGDLLVNQLLDDTYRSASRTRPPASTG
ncbi:MAG: TetR/AcrR family transcriptional regulator [Solirubrobacteraceae bacterium]